MTAIKTSIRPLISGKFVKQEGFNPHYVLTPLGARLSRVRVLGTVVSKFIADDRKFASIMLDDETDTLRIRVFGGISDIETIKIGDIVDVFGKVREYQDEIYIIPEIIKKTDMNMELLRFLELKKQEAAWSEKRKIIFEHERQVSDMEELKRIVGEFGIPEDDVEAILQSSEKEQPQDDNEKDKILELIRKLDKGDGCDYAALLESAGVSEDVLDAIINDLLTEGACFEPRPGKIKRL